LPTKGLDVLLDAFLSLLRREEFYGWRLVFAGEGPEDYVESLKRKVREEEATDSVTFRGWLAGQLKEAALRDCSLLALPSYHENFGLCVMESLAYGNPVLVSPYVNLAAEIEAAVAGWISEVNATALEETLAVALSSEAERLRRGENGRRVAENYAWPNVAKQLIQVYGEIISNVDQTSSVLQHA
jgi:glycosyltransferase involved in cell wall biosynthesis